MARRPDPTRIATARRSAAIARLISSGRSATVAAALVAEWEAAHAAQDGGPERSDWEGFERWLATRRPAG